MISTELLSGLLEMAEMVLKAKAQDAKSIWLEGKWNDAAQSLAAAKRDLEAAQEAEGVENSDGY